MVERLQESILAVCPIIGVAVGLIGNAATVRIDFAPAATVAERASAQLVVDTFDWSQGAHDTWLANKLRAAAKQFHTELHAENRALRATVKILVDELNILRQWMSDMKSVTAASSNYATLKSGIGTLPNTPARTYIQARNAIEALIDAEA